MTLKSGCGIGYEFSPAPKGAYVSGLALHFKPAVVHDIYDKVCFSRVVCGGRRGAQMAT